MALATESSAGTANETESSQAAMQLAHDALAIQQAFFETGETFDIDFRIRALGRLKRSIKAHEADLYEALQSDLGKPKEETYFTETGIVLSDLNDIIAHLRRWARPKRHALEAFNFPCAGKTIRVPWGCSLVLGTWNYPVQLALAPLAGAVAGGNTCILKPADHAPATAEVVCDIVAESFQPEHVRCIAGNHVVINALLAQPFDHVFLTGSERMGSVVLDSCAKTIAPSVLELGGLSPTIVCPSADLALAARRIVWGRYINSGQTCVAPDYVFVAEKDHDEFLACIKKEIERQLGHDSLKDPTWSRMVNKAQFDRVMALIEADRAKVVVGGRGDADTLKIEPTVVDGVEESDATLSQEIFGPVLPIMTYQDLSEVRPAIERIDATPLALYVFSRDTGEADALVSRIKSGGACINDVVVHMSTSRMPFGGVGTSGMGNYHGRWSFETFTHEKSVMTRGALDLPFRYRPYSEAKLLVIKSLLR
jgi:aldehyde dehydrogenase (NAD+)